VQAFAMRLKSMDPFSPSATGAALVALDIITAEILISPASLDTLREDKGAATKVSGTPSTSSSALTTARGHAHAPSRNNCGGYQIPGGRANTNATSRSRSRQEPLLMVAAHWTDRDACSRPQERGWRAEQKQRADRISQGATSAVLVNMLTQGPRNRRS